MPAEPALTQARGPRRRGGDDALRSWRARLEQSAALLAPIGLIVPLALTGGGYEVADRHFAGLAAWLVVVALIVLGAGSATDLGKPFRWVAGLLVGLVIWSALSSFWSGSVELSVIEADRVLVYLGFFLAAILLVQTNESRERFAEGLAISLALVALLALGSRLLPHVIVVTEGLGYERLRYPLGYWNANGALGAIAVPLLLWLSRRGNWAALRWFAVAAIPVVLMTVYFTYSRGAILLLAVGVVCMLVLSRDRLWLLATTAIGCLAVIPAILVVQSYDSLDRNLDTPAVGGQGAKATLVLLAGIAVALALFAVLRRLERGDGDRTGRALAISRDAKTLRRLGLVAALLAVAAAVAVGGRAWHQFTTSDIQGTANPGERISSLSGSGRHDFWRVAIDAFGEEPLVGHGAGTYVFSWDRHRSIPISVHNAHSLYLQSLAELGLIGGLLVLGLVGSALWFGFGAWRDASEPAREAFAALFAAMLLFAVGAAFDWFWQIAALGAIFFLAAGALVGARCAQVAEQSPSGARGGGRFGLAVAGLALAWVAAVALIGPLLVDREITSSQSAVAAGNLPAAFDHAETARSIEPWAASPYLQLGLVAERAGEYPRAAEMLTKAIEREEHNWELFALRARVEGENDETAAARRDLETARHLNPMAPQLQTGGE